MAKHNWYFRITANIHGSMTNAEKNNLYCHLSCSLSTAIYQLLISVIDTHRILSTENHRNMLMYYLKAFHSTLKNHYTRIRNFVQNSLRINPNFVLITWEYCFARLAKTRKMLVPPWCNLNCPFSISIQILRTVLSCY